MTSNNPFVIKRNDTSPTMQATLYNPDETAVNLTGATVRFHMKTQDRNTIIVDQPAIIALAAGGVVAYEWQVGDTANNGSYFAEWEVTYADGKIETFPNDEDDDIVVKIGRDLN